MQQDLQYLLDRNHPAQHKKDHSTKLDTSYQNCRADHLTDQKIWKSVVAKSEKNRTL